MTLLRWIVPASWLKCTWCRKWCQGPEKSSCVEFTWIYQVSSFLSVPKVGTESQSSSLGAMLLQATTSLAWDFWDIKQSQSLCVEQFVAEPFPSGLQNPKSAMLNVRSLGQYPLLVFCTALRIFLHLSLSLFLFLFLWKLWLVKTCENWQHQVSIRIYWLHAVPKHQPTHFARTFAWTSRSSALRQVYQHDLGQKSLTRARTPGPSHCFHHHTDLLGWKLLAPGCMHQELRLEASHLTTRLVAHTVTRGSKCKVWPRK